jgi:hypothetical protein
VNFCTVVTKNKNNNPVGVLQRDFKPKEWAYEA